MTKQITTLADLSQDDRNANKGNPRGRGMVETSLQKYGAGRSVLVDRNGKLIAGNKTSEAAAAIGLDDVVVVQTDGRQLVVVQRTDLDLNEDTAARELAIADNRAGELGLEWDTDVLASLGNEIDLSSFWTRDEIAALIKAETSGGGDDAPEVQDGPTRVQPGELWQLGRHRLLCSDNRNPESFDRLFHGDTPTALITDPPYGIGGASMTMGTKEAAKPRSARLSHGQTWDNARPDITLFLECAKWLCVWGGNYFADVLAPSNDWLCWHKKNDGLSFSEFELAWTNYGKQARHLSHHWGGEEKEHITQKPVDVMVFSIEKCPDASLVFDPFLGSGTTLIACERTGRRCYGIEISPQYCDVILRRFTAESGIEPVLIESGANAE